MTKRIILFSLTLLTLIPTTLMGCSGDSSGNEGLNIMTASYPLYDIARNVVGEIGNTELLLRAGQDVHSYEPTPKEIQKIKSCSLFLYIGGHSDSWVKRVISDNGDNTLTLLDKVPTLSEEGHGHDENEYDEHIWTSPKNMIIMTEAIRDRLCALCPDDAEYFTDNADIYINKLKKLDEDIRDTVEKAKRKTLVFADKFPFLYLVSEYGLSYHAALAGCSSESEVSAAKVAELVKTVKEENIPAVLCSELSNGRIADSVAAESGAKKLTVHPIANLTKEQLDSGEDYISLMYKNLDVLKRALN